VDNCIGYVAWHLRSNPNWLFRRALGYYGKNPEPYSDEPWVALLEERFGDRRAAQHLLKAFDASARITMEVDALAWTPQDIGHSHQLLLPYSYWTTDEPRWTSGRFWQPSPPCSTAWAANGFKRTVKKRSSWPMNRCAFTRRPSVFCGSTSTKSRAT